jgi:hypothetical protein
MQPKFEKKKIEILPLFPGYDRMVKKTISRYCPFKGTIAPDLIGLKEGRFEGTAEYRGW